MKQIEVGDLVFVRYRYHVAFFKSEPLAMAPQTRECVGWLVYDTPDYVIVALDRESGPPTLKGGDPKADGRVILQSEILELEKVGSIRTIFSSRQSVSSKDGSPP